MKILRSTSLEYVPASHEDQKNPGVWKKVLFQKNDLVKGRIQMINWAKLPAGKSFREHYHEDMDEIFIILSGTAEITIDPEIAILKKRDVVLTPMKKSHKMKALGKQNVEYIVIGITRGENGKTVITEKL